MRAKSPRQLFGWRPWLSGDDEDTGCARPKYRAGDTAAAPGVVVINEYMAQRYSPGEDAIGKRITLNNPSSSKMPAWLTVIGIVKNAVRYDWAAPPAEEFFLPYLQHTDTRSHYITLVVRTKGDPAALASIVENGIRQIDRNVTISEVQTMNAVVERATPRRASTWRCWRCLQWLQPCSRR